MKKIALTFDYELYFGKSGTLDNAIIKPTSELIRFFDDTGIKSTFFIDILYYWRLIDGDKLQKEQAKILKAQIQELVYKGHRIELHLHPHWVDAIFKHPHWDFSNLTHYRLHSFPENEIGEFFSIGTELLHKIAREVQPDYQIIAFRAGGWCLQPFEKIRQSFINSAIKIDSTVAPGLQSRNIYYFDFRGSPKKNYYFFDNDILIENTKGQFLEIPITIFKYNLIDKLKVRYYNHIGNQYLSDTSRSLFGDGYYMNNTEGKSIQKDTLISRIFENKIQQFSLDYFPPYIIENKVKRNPSKIINFISHPKDYSINTELNLKALFENKDFKFYTLYDLYQEIT